MVLDKLSAGETSLAEISQLDVAILRTARSELAEFDMRLDRAVLEYTSARKQLGDVPLRQEGVRGLLLGVAMDFALGQRLLEFSNLSLGEVGVGLEIQHL